MVEAALVESLRQTGAGVRFEWGRSAAGLAAREPCALAVVDTLSFTTAVSVATGRSIAVVPYPLEAEGAAELAARLDAALAVRRRELSPERPWSLSPRSLLAAPYTPRLVLPSPNGAAIAASVASRVASDGGADGTAVVAACLRNATATAGWLLARGFGTGERPVWLIGAGEQWPDGSLRPALEDQLGAGAVALGLQRAGCRLSPEARAVVATFSATPGLLEAIESCASGQELAAMGFPEEAGIAAALDADTHASVMEDGMFVQA